MADRTPRILLVGPMPPTKGGVTTFMLNLMGSPLRDAFTFVPFTTSRPPKKNVTENWGYRAMLRGGVARMCAGAAITLWHVCSFPFAVVLGRIDLVQIQACDYQVFWESALYAAMARLLGRKILFRIGGAFDVFYGGARPLEKRAIGAVLRLPDIVIAQSVFARDFIRRAGRTGDIVLLPNWSGVRDPGLPRRELGTVPTCLFIAGQEARRKGTEEVLAAAHLLLERACGIRFHMLALSPALMQRIAGSPLAGIVDMDGPVPHGHVLAAMRRYDIFLLPSHGEGFPNALVEAMAAGMACVATPVGAVPEMLAAEAGLLVPVGDSAALADAIAVLAGCEDRRRRLGERAHAVVHERYTPDAALPALAQAYIRLLAPTCLQQASVAGR